MVSDHRLRHVCSPFENANCGARAALTHERLSRDIAAYIAGDRLAAERVCSALEPVIRREVSRFFTASDPDHDDVVQETLVAWLAYLRRAGKSPDSPAAFVVTMTANRCRNLYWYRRRHHTVSLDKVHNWPSSGAPGPLEALEDAELTALLREALEQLDPPCRQLLSAIYFENRPMEELQREAGLGTVQGAFYRKYSCLKKLARLFNRRCFGGHGSGADNTSSDRPERA